MSLDLAIDWRVLAFTLSAAAATTVLSGTASAFRAASAAPMESLKEAPRGATSSGRAGLLQAILIGQVAFSIVLLVAAGLFVRTFESLEALPRGFDARPVLTATITLPRTAVPVGERLATFERIRERVLQIPGVAAAGVARQQLLTLGWTAMGLREISGRASIPPGAVVGVHEITPGWLLALGTPLLAGRDVNVHDSAAAQPVALVNEAFARKFLDGLDPIGHTVRGSFEGTREIVGVVGDVVYKSLHDPVPPTVYVPLLQSEVSALRPAPQTAVLSVRVASGEPAALNRTVARAINEINPALVVTFRPLSDQVDTAMNQKRVVAMISTFFGALALLLAALGLYGVTSYVVGRRRTELGIRLALGAQSREIVRLVMTRFLVLVGAGVVAGVLASLWAARFVETLLFGLDKNDPATLVGACVVIAVAAVAAGVPAYRASRIDPAAFCATP